MTDDETFNGRCMETGEFPDFKPLHFRGVHENRTCKSTGNAGGLSHRFRVTERTRMTAVCGISD